MDITKFACMFLAVLACTPFAWSQAPKVGPEFQVSDYPDSPQMEPEVGVSSSGDFIVTWRSDNQDGDGAGIFARRYDNTGNPLDPLEFLVNTITTSAQTSPAVGVWADGAFVIVWSGLTPQPGGWEIFARRFDSLGNALDTSEFQVNTYHTFQQYRPSVAVSGSGNFIVAWDSAEQDGSGYGVFARRYDSAGAPLDPQEFQVNDFTTSDQFHADVAANGAGKFLIIWQSLMQDGSAFGVFGRRYDDSGNAIGDSEFQVNSYTLYTQARAYAAMTESGDFVVAWNSDHLNQSEFDIFARRFDSVGVPLEPAEFQVNTYTTSYQLAPSVGADGMAGIVLAWTSWNQDGSGTGVFARRYDDRGEPVDMNEFVVNTTTISEQSYPSLAVSTSGDFLVAWRDDYHDSPYSEIMAQFFCGDLDDDGICNAEDILVTAPINGSAVDCRKAADPSTRPTIAWDPGDYDKFRVQISWRPKFPKKRRITSGKTLLMDTTWRPGKRRWRRVCQNAGSNIYVRVLGIDHDTSKQDPRRKTFSQVVKTYPIK